MAIMVIHKRATLTHLLSLISDSPLPAGCEVEFTVPLYYSESIRNILRSSKNHKEEDATRLLALFSSAILKSTHETQKLKVSSLIITSSTLVVTQDKVQWLLPGNNKLPSIVAEQGMSNLIEVVSTSQYKNIPKFSIYKL